MGSEKVSNNHAYIIAQPPGVFTKEELKDLKLNFDEFVQKLEKSGNALPLSENAGSLGTAFANLATAQAVLLECMEYLRLARVQKEIAKQSEAEDEWNLVPQAQQSD